MESSNEKMMDKRKVLGKNNKETRKIKGIWATRVTEVGKAAVLSTSFNVNVTSDNVKNHIKLWRSWYGIVSDILGQGGFEWDDTKHMITVENENAWNEYCTSHKSAKPFRFKVLQNWDDIVDLCAKDKATSHGAETAMDADEAMSRETNEVEFMGLGATAIDLEEPRSNTKGKRQGFWHTSSQGKDGRKRRNSSVFE
ncbi:hypothetical protein GmHk_16G046618 [Glycine max]|nr:hypothetical protein GmHk_16G046618 [Glycine max]